MGKRKSIKNRSHVRENPNEFDDVDDANPESEDFIYDEIDKFHAKKEESILGKYVSHVNDDTDEEREVLRVDVDDESDYEDDAADEEDEDDDDDDEDGDDGMPSSKAWGTRKSLYYGAESLEGLKGVDRDEVEDEEEAEALKIQRRLAEEIDEDQFELFQEPESSQANDALEKQEGVKVTTDVSNLSTKAQWKLLKQDSPELKDLIDDFKIKSLELKSTLLPLLELVKSGRISGKGAIYVQTKFNLYISYLMNISFYMSLKAKRKSLRAHPVIKRLVQYKTLINKLATIDQKVESEIEEILLRDIVSDDGSDNSNSISSDMDMKEEEDDVEIDEQVSKVAQDSTKEKKSDDITVCHTTLNQRIKIEDEKEMLSGETEVANADNEDDGDRRAITYTMSKNKGAKSKKRKIDRNPRVKHREKYRKAKIRRRGQVRTYKPEIQKYSGEASGIRATIVRSVPIQ